MYDLVLISNVVMFQLSLAYLDYKIDHIKQSKTQKCAPFMRVVRC